MKYEESVSRPDHYHKEYQVTCHQCQEACLDGIEDGMQASYMFNIIKYLYRFSYKNGVEDLKKAATYLRFLINDIEGRQHDA